jgi:uncharacterized protein (TIGR02996 family)
MSQEADLIQAMRDSPDDTAPWLAYAEWLDRNGRPELGELIRIECDLEAKLRSRGITSREDDPELFARRDQLIRTHEEEWQRPLREMEVWPTDYHRGLISSVQMTPQMFATQADLVFNLAPGLKEITFSGADAAFASFLAGSAYLGFLSGVELVFECEVGDVGVQALASSPHVRKLQRLNLYHNDIGVAGVTALAGSEYLGALKELSLRENRAIGDAGAEVLAASGLLKRLKHLDLCATGIGGPGASAFLAKPETAGLDSLDLYSNCLGNQGAGALLTLPQVHLPFVVYLGGNGIGPQLWRRLKERFGDALQIS